MVDQETAAHTNHAKIENICTPFDHLQITIEIDFDKVMRGPGYWKLNNSHLKNEDFIFLIKLGLVQIVYENQKNLHNPKTIRELADLTPLELQQIKTTLNPQELLEQVHFTLTVKIISYSIRLNNKKRTSKQT